MLVLWAPVARIGFEDYQKIKMNVPEIKGKREAMTLNVLFPLCSKMHLFFPRMSGLDPKWGNVRHREHTSPYFPKCHSGPHLLK